jgi:hypothetical protein
MIGEHIFKYLTKIINPFIFLFAIILYIGYLIGQSIVITYPSAIICLIYIWIHCLFGITLYGDKAIPFTEKWRAYIKLMDKEFDEDVHLFYKNDSCVEPTLFKIIIRNIVKIIRCNLNLLLLMSMIFFFFMESIYKLNSETFKKAICTFLGGILGLIVVKFGYNLYRDYNKKNHNINEPICIKDNYFSTIWNFFTSLYNFPTNSYGPSQAPVNP